MPDKKLCMCCSCSWRNTSQLRQHNLTDLRTQLFFVPVAYSVNSIWLNRYFNRKGAWLCESEKTLRKYQWNNCKNKIDQFLAKEKPHVVSYYPYCGFISYLIGRYIIDKPKSNQSVHVILIRTVNFQSFAQSLRVYNFDLQRSPNRVQGKIKCNKLVWKHEKSVFTK